MRSGVNILKTDPTPIARNFEIVGRGTVVESHFSKVMGEISTFYNSVETVSRALVTSEESVF